MILFFLLLSGVPFDHAYFEAGPKYAQGLPHSSI